MKVFFELSAHSIYEITGADKERYLQGRLTQNIKSINIASSLLLTPQGKILAKMLISKEKESFLFIVDPCDDFVANLLKFKVADDLVVTKLDCSIFSVIGELETNFKKIKSPRYSQDSLDVIVPFDKKQDFTSELEAKGFTLGSEQQRNYLRIKSLKPEFGADIDQTISATEIPYQDLISFNKGCYAGQEVVEMSTARGKPNKKLIALKAEKEIQSKELYADQEKNKSCGQIQTIANHNQETIAFAYVKTAIADQNEFYNSEQKLVKLND